MRIRCPYCAAPMQKKMDGGGGCVAQLLCVAAGIIIIGLLGLIGWLIGGLLILSTLFMHGKKVWRCSRCRALVPRG